MLMVYPSQGSPNLIISECLQGCGIIWSMKMTANGLFGQNPEPLIMAGSEIIASLQAQSASFGLPIGHTIVEAVARNRQDVEWVTGRCTGGVLAVDATVRGLNGDGTYSKRIVEINDDHRPLTEDLTADLGALAIENEHNGYLLYGTVFACA
jgi:hypothetical protein